MCANLIHGTTMNVAQPSGRPGSSNVAINVLRRRANTVCLCLHQRNRLEKHAGKLLRPRLVEQKRRRFWRTQADNSANPSRLWQTIDAVLGRGKENNPTSLSPEDLIQEAPNKQSWLDPIPTWLLKECSDVLSPF